MRLNSAARASMSSSAAWTSESARASCRRCSSVIPERRCLVAAGKLASEAKLLQHLRDDGQQVGFGDGLHRGQHLPLRDAVDGVDEVPALDAVKIALVHAVDADEARAALGAGARRTPLVAVRSPPVWVSTTRCCR